MNQHEQITRDLDALIDQNRDAEIITPASIALILQHRYADGTLPPPIEYASLEHLKQMARKRLARQYDADSDDAEAYSGQGELFSGHLQDRYPLPHQRGREPAYKRREALTAEERQWNVSILRKSAQARLAHADALEAEGLDHVAVSAR